MVIIIILIIIFFNVLLLNFKIFVFLISLKLIKVQQVLSGKF